MPVMKVWRGDKPTQWPKADADIGMDEDRLPLVKHRKNHNCCIRKAQCKNRNQRDALSCNLIHWMNAAGCQPVKLLDTVMDLVKPPKQGNRVKHAMDKIEPQISEHNNLDDLKPVRLIGHSG